MQPEGDVVIGSARELAMCAKGSVPAAPGSVPAAPGGNQHGLAVGEEGEGAFSGMERLAASGGSVMVWDSTDSIGEATVSILSLRQLSVWVVGGGGVDCCEVDAPAAAVCNNSQTSNINNSERGLNRVLRWGYDCRQLTI